ncbi:MAG: hypothetical protein Q7T33_16255 [Dehalococcoidia bacterium]|nr:hypothetical protein [Dehalococcoidia bacterium]
MTKVLQGCAVAGRSKAAASPRSPADIGYEVVPDIESLPSRITTLYRQLTA